MEPKGWAEMMIGRGHRRRPLEPVDRWLNEAGHDTHDRISAVYEQLRGEDAATVLAGLEQAGVEGPPEAVQGLVRRISEMPTWAGAPEGAEWRDAKGRRHRIAVTTRFQVRGDFRRPE